MSRRSLVAVLLVVALAGCADSDPKVAAPASSSAAPSTTVAPARPFTVTRRDITVVDTTRGTNAEPDRGIAALPTRTLPVMLLVPDGPGPFPLLEFSHGVTGTGPGQQGFLTQIAAAGYVVAAPTFPLSSGPEGTIFDYGNQPGDVYFVIDEVIKMSADGADPLHGLVDAKRIALSGHSLGAMTTYGAGYNSCCAQKRVDAVIMFAGIEAPFPNGDYSVLPVTPLLLAHGAADKTISVDGSDKIFSLATGPTEYLRFPDGTHSGILRDADGTLVRQAVIAWLDKWLRDDPTGLDDLPAAVTSSGLATLQSKNL